MAFCEYDWGVNTFSPEGRLFQVEYAIQAVKLGSTAVGIRTAEGVVLAVEKRLTSPLLNADCVVVVEYPVERGKPPFRIGELVGVRNRRYGRTALAFYAFKPSGALEALRPRPEEFEEFS